MTENGSEIVNIASTSNDQEKPDDEAESFECLVCKKTIDDGKSKSVQCAICNCWSHLRCSMTKEVFDLLSKMVKNKQGKRKAMVFAGSVPYICEGCQIFLRPNSTDVDNDLTTTRTSKTLSDATPSTQTVFQVSSSVPVKSTEAFDLTKPSSSLIQPGVNSTQKDAPSTSYAKHDEITTNDVPSSNLLHNEINNNVQKPICHRYKQGKCPHGKSGNRIVNGQRCNFDHPRKCIKFCRFGHDKIQGCNGPCQFFHPILCRNSVRYRRCLLDNCTFAHLLGTERYTNHLDQNHHFSGRSNYRHSEFSPQNNYGSKLNGPSYNNHEYPRYIRPNVDEREFYKRNVPIQQPATEASRIGDMETAIKQMQQSINLLIQNSHLNVNRPMVAQPNTSRIYQFDPSGDLINNKHQQPAYNNFQTTYTNPPQPPYYHHHQRMYNKYNQPMVGTHFQMEAKKG